ncbi:MAG TPA: penicillin-binding transpeptidase domain-containing protein [Candidatus Limnocylindria bacterium]|nr:penicillin-binding transpeptidase domain-containing protein [Candidatus Limnocylindria bacterium]
MRRATRPLLFLFLVASVLSACQEPGPPSPEPTARKYAEAWQKSDFRAMWDLLTDASKERVGEAGFVERLPRIAQEMTLTSLEAKAGAATRPRGADGSPDPRRATVALAVTFRTQRVGEFRKETPLRLVLEGEKDKAIWKIEWTPEAILPELSTGRLVRMTRLPTTRGRIVARDGSELATFVDAISVGVIPGQIRDEAGLLASLGSVIGMSGADIKAKYTQSWVRADTFVPIRTVFDASLQGRLSVIEGVSTRPVRARSYPSGLAAQTIGYVGEASEDDAKKRAGRGVEPGDLVGKTGLEAALDDLIGGTYGWRLSVVEPNETPVVMLGERLPTPGPDAVLALDPAMQRAAEDALGAERGAIVVEDPWSGEILAIASRPSFDLNAFVRGDSAAIARFNADPKKPVFNRATFGQYATGSTFKMVTAAAALRNGIFRAGDRLDCPVRWTGYGPQWVQVNHESGDLGSIDLRTALARSCNTFFYELGKRLNDKDPNLLPNEAKSFGLGKATDIEFVFEEEGLVPSPAWKQQRFTSPAERVWNPGDATNLAIGQGYLLATPIQMANYAAAIASDGIVWKPRLVIRLQDREGKPTKEWAKAELGRALAIPTELSLIRDGMRAVVADPDGTVYFPFRGFGVEVAGKSGTAETSEAGRVNAWFVGMAPWTSPQVAFTAVLEGFEERPGRHGSQDAATAIRKVLAARFGTP